MLSRNVEQEPNVGVVEAVKHHPTIAAGSDDASRPKQTKRVRDVGLGRAGDCGQVADTQLAGLEEGVEESRACLISEQLEELGKVCELRLGKQLLLGRFDPRCIDERGGAGVETDDFVWHSGDLGGELLYE